MKKSIIALTLISAQFTASVAAPSYHLVLPMTSGSPGGPSRAFSVAPGVIAFGDVQAGASAQQPVVIANTGSSPLTSPSVTIEANALEYSVTHDCPDPLAARSSCEAQVTFRPTADPQAGRLGVAFAGVSAQAVGLSGQALLDMLMGSALGAYGPVETGMSASRTFSIRNDGNGSAALSYGAMPASVERSGTCGSVLAAGASCDLILTWAPVDRTTLDTTIQVSGQHSSVHITLQGTPVLAADLTGGGAQDYGNLMVGESRARTWTLNNAGEAAASLIYGTLPADITKAGTCGAALAGSASCTVILTWAPSTAVALNATYPVSNQTLTLTGTAVAQAPAATLDATTHAFGSVTIGQAPTKVITLTNSGNVALTLPANVGTATAPYSVTDTCATTLAVGANCTATITYTPTVAGAHNSSVTINTGAAGDKTVSVTGTGTAPANPVTSVSHARIYQSASTPGDYDYVGTKVTLTAPGLTLSSVAMVPAVPGVYVAKEAGNAFSFWNDPNYFGCCTASSGPSTHGIRLTFSNGTVTDMQISNLYAEYYIE